jgi:hypothetical protein
MAEPSPAYTEIRETLLAVAPNATSMPPSEGLAHVYGVVMDIGFDPLYTVAAFSDGSTSAYDGNGGGTAGLGDLGEMAVISRGLLRAIEADLGQFAPVDSSPLPAYGRVRFTVLTYEARLGLEVEGTVLVKGEHPLSKPFAAALAIIDRARQVTSQTH